MSPLRVLPALLVIACGNPHPDVQSSCTGADRVVASAAKRYSGAIPHIRAGGDEIRGLAVAGALTIAGRDNHGLVERYDSAGSRRTWQWSAPGRVHNDPLLDEDRVVVTWGDSHPNNARNDSSTTLGRSGGVAALELASGQPLWVRPMPASVMTGAVRIADTLYVVIGDRWLIALEPRTGDERFRVRLPGLPSMATPQVVDSMLVLALSVPSTTAMFDPRQRRISWSTRIPQVDAGINDVVPLVAHGMLVTTGTRRVGNAAMARPIGWPLAWRKLQARFGHGDPLPAPTEQWVFGVDRCSGRLLWSTRAGLGTHVESNRSGTPVSDGTRVFVASTVLQELVALDFHGRLLWSQVVRGIAKGAPIVMDSTVFAFTQTGDLMAFDARTGSRGRVIRTARPIGFVIPRIFGDSAVASTRDGGVFAVGLRER